MAYTDKANVLAIGTGEISTGAKVATGLELEATWTAQFVSLEGTCKITQAADTVNKVKIDQSDAAIGVTRVKGEITVEFDLPNTAASMWEKFYNEASGTAAMYAATAGKTVTGILLTAKDISDMLKIKMKKGGQTYIFPNLDWGSAFKKDSETNPACFTISCTVLGTVDGTAPDMIIVTDQDGSAA